MTTVILIAIGAAAVLFMGWFFVGLCRDSKVAVPCCVIPLSQQRKAGVLECGTYESHLVAVNSRGAA